MHPDQASPSEDGAGAEKTGCLKIFLMLLGGGVVLLIVVAVTSWLILQTKMNPTDSGNAVGTRPVGPTAAAPPPTSVPPGAESVEPIPRDQMLVSVVDRPAFDPCGGSGPGYDIQVMGTDGENRRDLTDDPALESAINTGGDENWPRLSPDRRRFVFYRGPAAKAGEHCRYFVQELWITNVDGTGLRPVFTREQLRTLAREMGWPADGLVQGHADWSPDGRHVVMFLGHVPSWGPIPVVAQGEIQLFTLDVDDGTLEQKTDRTDAQGRGSTVDPSYTPDGSTILFVGCPDRRSTCDTTGLRSIPADSVKVRDSSLVYTGDKGPNDAYVSPDGRSISWMEVGLLRINLYVAPFELGKPVTKDERMLVDAHGGYANWTADSRKLIYNRVWIVDKSPLFSNGFDDRPSRRITPSPTTELFMFPSP